MKRKDFTEIKLLDKKALIAKVQGLRAEIGDLVMDKQMNKLKDLKLKLKKRKDLAQILTVLRQKDLVEALEVKEGVKV